MRYLVTSSRMPYALDEIRKLGRHGHEVHAADTTSLAPGSRSKYVHKRHVTPSPRYDTRAYLESIRQIVDEQNVQCILPTFEEVFFLQYSTGTLHDVEVFAPSFPLLEQLHNKARFVALAQHLGACVREPLVVSSKEALREGLDAFKHYFARPTYSRGGVSLLTNFGPLANAASPEDCTPTEENPWLIQEYIDGRDICSFSMIRNGQVTAHATYAHPKTIESAGGISFISIEEPRTLELVQRIAEETGYHGQLSLDFLLTEDDELFVVECNPRATAGAIVMPSEMFIEGLLGPIPVTPRVAPAGRQAMIRSAVVRNMLLHPEDLLSDLAYVFSRASDVYFDRRDPVPSFFQFASLIQLLEYARRPERNTKSRSALLAGYLFDVSWDGQPIEA